MPGMRHCAQLPSHRHLWHILLPCVQALCPGVRRCFQLNMLPGGRRDGRLVCCEPAVETTAQASMVFLSKHPRFYPAPPP